MRDPRGRNVPCTNEILPLRLEVCLLAFGGCKGVTDAGGANTSPKFEVFVSPGLEPIVMGRTLDADSILGRPSSSKGTSGPVERVENSCRGVGAFPYSDSTVLPAELALVVAGFDASTLMVTFSAFCAFFPALANISLADNSKVMTFCMALTSSTPSLLAVPFSSASFFLIEAN